MKRIKMATVGIALGVTLGLAGSAFAGPGFDKSRFDTNNDGQVDQTEMKAAREAFRAMKMERRQKMLEKFDSNRDGELDETERKAAHASRVEERFKALDKDGNGSLSLEEFKAGKHFKMKHGRKGRR